MLDELSTKNWRILIAATARKAPCLECGLVSGWHPRNWMFRHIPQRGGNRNAPKVKTERICPACSVKLLGEVKVKELRGITNARQTNEAEVKF